MGGYVYFDGLIGLARTGTTPILAFTGFRAFLAAFTFTLGDFHALGAARRPESGGI
ncbi:hypothetical protein [Mobiluncus mulieris]|uniref:hypothetical protein n=1 Tax=Mobiluncus mulieris TaxID=2052 RepID=UPI002091F082|nr:hypothetical protein [Mobiluncus mulieris]